MIVLIFLLNLLPKNLVVEKERGIIEETYTNIIAKELLKIIPEDKYTISISAELKPDEDTLKKYYEEEEADLLPGLTIKNTAIFRETSNNLVAMLANINIAIFIDTSIDEAKLPLIENIVKNKVKFDARRGDKIELSRIKFPEKPILKDKENNLFSSKFLLIASIVLVSFIALLIVLFWQISLLKSELKNRAKLKADIEIDSNGISNAIKLPQELAGEKTESEDKSKETKLNSRRSIAEYRDKILNLGVTDPKACSTAIRKLIATHDGIMKAAILVEEIGYDYAKKIFTGLSNSKWNELGKYIKDNIEDINPNKIVDIISEAYYLILGESISTDGNINKNNNSVFDLISNLSETELKKLIDTESNTNIALIASYYDSEQMVDIIKLLPETRQKEVVLEIARFERLPKDIVSKAAEELSVKLKKLHDPNTIEFKGYEYIGNFLNYIDQEQEEKLLSYIENVDPKLRNSLRKYHFSFEDVKLVPDKYIEPAIEDFDAKFLAKALYKVSSELISKITGVLPEKKALMLNDELSIEELVSKKEVLSARTKLLTAIKNTLIKFDFDFSSLNAEEVYVQEESTYIEAKNTEDTTEEIKYDEAV